MSWNASWMRVVRAVVVTGLLVLALIGAVLGAIGSRGHSSNFAHTPDATGEATPPPAPNGMKYRIGTAPTAPEKLAVRPSASLTVPARSADGPWR